MRASLPRFEDDYDGRKMREAMAEHVSKGGMLLRKLDAVRLHHYGFRLRHG